MTRPRSTDVRVRYAPSPTGDFHVGGARTALFNYLFARHHGGKFLLRIEDTDQLRFQPNSLDRILDGLKFIGLEWDEGPEVGGPSGPYVQSERLDLYQRYCQSLIEKGRAYRCFCSLGHLRGQTSGDKAEEFMGYNRRCRNIEITESERRAAAGEPYTVRIKLPLQGQVTVHDLIRGSITFENAILHDAIIMKSDGVPTYHLANVVDDHLMEISHVLRGDEWLSSLPLHIHLYQAFDWSPPVMAHLPLILNPTGRGKMSKRDGSSTDGRILPVFVHSFQALGYLPEALINYLALLGWSYDDKTEIMTREELINRFSLERVRSSPAKWDYEKLKYLNGVYIRNLPSENLSNRLRPYLVKDGIQADLETLQKITPLIQERLKILSEVTSWVGFLFREELPDYDLDWLVPKKLTRQEAANVLQYVLEILPETNFNHETLEVRLRTAAVHLGTKPKDVFQIIRVAVCGQQVAPPLIGVLEIMGRDTVIKRLKKACERIKGKG